MADENYVDFSEVYKGLKKINKNADRMVAQGINEAGDYAKRYLAVKTPMSRKGGQHAKRHVVASKATTSKHELEVGYDKEVAWRMHFVEFGTIKQRPQHFIKRTISDIEAKVSSIIEKAMRRAFLS